MNIAGFQHELSPLMELLLAQVMFPGHYLAGIPSHCAPARGELANHRNPKIFS